MKNKFQAKIIRKILIHVTKTNQNLTCPEIKLLYKRQLKRRI
jgi:hypothetical protein